MPSSKRLGITATRPHEQPVLPHLVSLCHQVLPWDMENALKDEGIQASLANAPAVPKLVSFLVALAIFHGETMQNHALQSSHSGCFHRHLARIQAKHQRPRLAPQALPRSGASRPPRRTAAPLDEPGRSPGASCPGSRARQCLERPDGWWNHVTGLADA